MTAAQIIERVQISQVAVALGCKVDPSARRCICPWRRGADGMNISLDDSKNAWFDHARSEGGGLLDFIARVRGSNRRDAAQWLASFTGVQLEQPSPAAKRDLARRISAARPEAEALVRWKYETLAALRQRRNVLQRIYHGAIKFVLSHDAEECEQRGDLRMELALTIGWTYWDRVEELDAEIDRLEASSYADLLARFRSGAVA